MHLIIKLLGGYILKKLLINWLLPTVLDMAINALLSLARRSDNKVDDEMVATLIENQDKLLDEIKRNL